MISRYKQNLSYVSIMLLQFFMKCLFFLTKTIELLFVASPLSTQHYGVRVKTGWFRISIMCTSGTICLPVEQYVYLWWSNMSTCGGAICLPVDCCF